MFLIGTLLSFLCILGAVSYSGIEITDLINFPTFFVIFFPVFFTGFLIYPKQFGNAFRSLLDSSKYSKKERQIHSSIFELMGRVSIGMGLIAFTIFFISEINSHLTVFNLDSILKIISKSFLPIFYGLMLEYLFFIPASIKVKNNVKD